MGWYEDRFLFSQTKINKKCSYCFKNLWFPASQANKRKTCGILCSKKLNQENILKRNINCIFCNSEFVPRKSQIKNGQGKFCSISCATVFNRQLWSAKARIKSTEKFLNNIKTGKYIPPKGENHSQYNGGLECTNLRRNQKLYGRLKKGFIEKLGNLQQWKCAICKSYIKHKFHKDHVLPLILGGIHEERNIQLLCPTCNLRKNRKDPIVYMQSLGFLL